MNPLLEKLKALFGMQAPPTPAPGDGVDVAHPWDSPVLRPPAAANPVTQPTPGPSPTPDLGPIEEALKLALMKKKINQDFSGATGNPIPQ